MQICGFFSPRQGKVGGGMNTPLPGLPLSAPIPNAVKKRRVLLVDSSQSKRDLRAKVMRRLGIEVDCAADISEALSWWRADLYHLVLINVQNDIGQRDDFCEVIRGATPPQQLAFLVGKPEYSRIRRTRTESLPTGRTSSRSRSGT